MVCLKWTGNWKAEGMVGLSRARETTVIRGATELRKVGQGQRRVMKRIRSLQSGAWEWEPEHSPGEAAWGSSTVEKVKDTDG